MKGTVKAAVSAKPASRPAICLGVPFSWYMTLRLLSRYALALLFTLAGLWHFVHPSTYVAIMPPQLPAPLGLVYVSGFFEIVGGLGLLVQRTRRIASWGLLALLVAVFPANVYMALIHEQLGISSWVAWGRLPLQLPLLWWVWKASHLRPATAPGANDAV